MTSTKSFSESVLRQRVDGGNCDVVLTLESELMLTSFPFFFSFLHPTSFTCLLYLFAESENADCEVHRDEEPDMMPALQLRTNFPWLSLVFANASFTSTSTNSERLPSIFASIEEISWILVCNCRFSMHGTLHSS
jgi:hypothetical protein